MMVDVALLPLALWAAFALRLGTLAPAEPVTHPVPLVLVARLLVEKGVNEYVEAARQLKRIHPDARFLLVGGTDANPSALPLLEAEDWVREGIIKRTGQVSDVRPWRRLASVFVLPS